ncbi:UDP-N-acetylmuramoyl-L-alanyl-D-glutamate--2,6-diaminopimelate ligase [Capnocytophaga canis]|uniref:UDP-N-acetylmuramoyl-L-alanyl-D-glutamate--2, 6-diaminopimelate ligase n=1 Tax=Capnocytophaga canis TaxID=1848903 RepID=UPI0015629F87|nr:UDP-N-acetylmuramoyl-L-alanyl-D-glutamate--2,6-diaminopimelate ligase [Capnocytophaga canis]
MNLKKLLQNIEIISLSGETNREVGNIVQDSRAVKPNDLFIAIKGTASDGHLFIDKAIENGAKIVVSSPNPSQGGGLVERKEETQISAESKAPLSLGEEVRESGVCEGGEEPIFVEVSDTTAALATMASNFYDNPSEKLQLVGITGTNGKTTTTSLLYQLFRKVGYKVGLISTIAIYVDDQKFETKNTTPDILTLNKYLKMMVDAGCQYCFMEVSSHGVEQRRIEGLQFAGGVFTNLTHDHLDYHQTFANYRDAKKKFFDQLPKTAFALTNIDDKNGNVMLQNTKAQKKSYALKSFADYRLQILENQFSGLVLKIDGQEVWTNLIGQFNAYNLLAVYAVADLLGVERIENLTALSTLQSVGGRFQYFVSKDKITAIVDYAHTPDALQNVLDTINNIRTKNEQLITVVGCGGNRDKSKRPVMADISTKESTRVIFTSDNPRDEDPQTILDEMEAGVSAEHYKKFVTIADRHQAIKTACQFAKLGDIILIAGKGHETYQEIKGERTHFDDMEEVKKILNV